MASLLACWVLGWCDELGLESFEISWQSGAELVLVSVDDVAQGCQVRICHARFHPPASSEMQLNHSELHAHVADVMRLHGGLGRLQPLGGDHLVADHSEKFLVISPSNKITAVASVSPASAPKKELLSAEASTKARTVLGPTLGRVVVTPWHVGLVDQVSVSVTPFVPPLGDRSLLRYWRRWRLRRPLLLWLLEVNRSTKRIERVGEAESRFDERLSAVEAAARLPLSLRFAASRARRALVDGQWRPHTVLAHNDFWLGNVHLGIGSNEGGWPFTIIDWLGARVDGHAMYDLIRLSLSLGMNQYDTSKQIALHMHALDEEVAHAEHHLAAALGFLALNLGDWPFERYADTAARCHDWLALCMPAAARYAAEIASTIHSSEPQ